LLAAAVAAALATPAAGSHAAEPPVIIFAAASLADVLGVLEARWRSAGLGPRLRFSFAASSTLARQIEQGAPAQIFISADEAWMDHLASRGLVEPATRRIIASNRLVVVRGGAPTAAEPPEDGPSLRAALAIGQAGERVATGDPAHVPAGRYAQAALASLGLWEAVAPRLVRADNVRSALAFVERGEAAAGIVYATDAAGSRSVAIAARFPARSHPAIRYPAALVAGAPRAARDVLERLATPDTLAVLQATGFGPP
jgi:molybdate transport system substrate-binding protein